jgi:opacity protein-like surface antigen
MIKKSLLLVGLLIGTNSMAQNYFVGVDYLQMNTSTSSSDNTKLDGEITSEHHDTFNLPANSNLNLKFGIDNIAHGRTYIKVGNLYNKYNYEYFSLSANYDYYINKFNIFTPYIGAGIGNGKLTLLDKSPKLSDTSLDYTARVGSIIDIKDNLKAEIGYQYTRTNTETKEIINHFNGSFVDTYYTKIEKIKGYYISLNYGF